MLAPVMAPDENSRLQTLYDIRILDTPIEAPFEHLTKLTKRIFRVPIVAVSLVDKERQWFKSIQGLNVCQTSREVSFCGHAILQRDVFVVSNALQDKRFADNPLVTGAPNIRFYAGCPVYAENGQALGTLCLIDTKPRAFTDEEAENLRDLAALVETEIRKYSDLAIRQKLSAELSSAKHSSMVDELTRLWNRRAIDDILENRLNDCCQNGKQLGVAMIDIDHFKQVNDQHGHTVGDDVLCQVSKRLLESCRDNDAIGRWGGEEFVMIAELDSLQSLHKIAERMRYVIEQSSIEIEGGQKIQVTITIGLSLFNSLQDMEKKQLIDIVDMALYQGKANGRNQVYVVNNFH